MLIHTPTLPVPAEIAVRYLLGLRQDVCVSLFELPNPIKILSLEKLTTCDKKEPKNFNLDFYLKKKNKNWDRFEIPKYENEKNNIVYVLGAGASDYLKLHYNDNGLIIKLAYRSEDPG